jgi:hypothetical protein
MHENIFKLLNFFCQATKNGSASPVYAAALRGHVEIIRILVENSFDVNSQNEQGIKSPIPFVSFPSFSVFFCSFLT